MITQSSPAAVNNGASIVAVKERAMQESYSNPDGVTTADLALERDTVDLENVTENHLRESIANCENPSMLLSALCSIDKALEYLEARKKQAESKVYSLAFAAELVA